MILISVGFALVVLKSYTVMSYHEVSDCKTSCSALCSHASPGHYGCLGCLFRSGQCWNLRTRSTSPTRRMRRTTTATTNATPNGVGHGCYVELSSEQTTLDMIWSNIGLKGIKLHLYSVKITKKIGCSGIPRAGTTSSPATPATTPPRFHPCCFILLI